MIGGSTPPHAMRLLWIATKPPAPPVDGGRLVALLTLQALAGERVEIVLVAPVAPETPEAEVARIEAVLAPFCRAHLVPAKPRPATLTALGTLLGGAPYSIARHALPEVRAEVARRLAAESFDAVHAEQLQTFPQAEPAFAAGVPVVLRAQNVESDLWRATAGLHPWAGRWLAREAGRLARFEGEAVRRSAATIALTASDAERLRRLAGGSARVEVVPPPFPAELPAADTPLPGEPALVLLGSGGWLPNRDGTRWFLEEVWPTVRARTPGVRLHLFAGTGERPVELPAGVEPHPPPDDSRDAFAPGSILVVPLRIASGIRMKILEAWARGVPVIATPEAAAGLGAEDGRELLVAQTPEEWAAAVARLREPAGREARVSGGRRTLAERHAPAGAAAGLADLYRGAARRTTARSLPPSSWALH